MRATVRRRKKEPAPLPNTGAVKMYAMYIDMDEFYELAIVEKSAAADEVTRKYCEFAEIDAAEKRVTFFYRTEEDRAIAFCRVKNVFPSAYYASGAVYVDKSAIEKQKEKK